MNRMRKLLSMLLVLAILLSCLPGAVLAEGAAAGQFVLAAMTKDDFFLEPEYLSYTQGQTVKEALLASAHTFTGIETGFIYTIDGVTDNFVQFYDGGGYDLDAAASGITVLCFTTEDTNYSPEKIALLGQMAAYRGETNGVQGYSAAQKAYADALAECYGADGTRCESLYTALKTAMDAYESFLSGEKTTLKLQVAQGGRRDVPVDITLYGEFGNTVTARKATQVEAVPGRYTFDLTDGDVSHVRGEIVIASGGVLTATLPDGNWIASADLGLENGENWSALTCEARTAAGGTYYVPDYCIGNLYPYVIPGDAVDVTKVGLYLAGKETLAKNKRVWESKQTSLAGVVARDSMAGADVVLEARLADGDYEQYQTYTFRVLRVPTLSALTVTGDGTKLPLKLEKAVTEYTLHTTSDEVEVLAQPLCAEAAVTIAGQTALSGVPTMVSLSGLEQAGGAYLLPIVLSGDNGVTRHYLLRIIRQEAVSVCLTHGADVTVTVINEAGAEIAPSASAAGRTDFRLVPGETYTYLVTKNTYYHTTAAFTASAGKTVSVPTPDTADYLESLNVRENSKGAELPQTPETFVPGTHAYTYEVGTNQSSFGLIPKLNQGTSGYTMTAYYNDYRVWDSTYAGEKTRNVRSGSFTALSAFLGASGRGNEVRLAIAQPVRNGVTYYEDYILTAVRRGQLNDLTLSAEGRAVSLYQKGTQSTGFFKSILGYTASVGQMVTQLDAGFVLLSTASAQDSDFTVTVRCGDWSQTIEYAGTDVTEARTVQVPLNTELALETITLTVTHAEALSQCYTVEVAKLPPVKTRIVTEPADAGVFLREKESGLRALPEADGSYTLNTGLTYLCSVTAPGYVGSQVSFLAGPENETVTVRLEAAPEQPYEDIAREGDFASFRGNDANNAVVDVPTPIAAGEAVLTWANKLGDGYSAGAAGSPVLVGGNLYSYAAKQIFKLDKTTGEILETKPMAASSSFAITPPAYAEGMIFVALSNGTIQAFDAETLDSLWIYHDPLGGQPNCPITYRNGRIYTGFWNAEDRKANFVCLTVTDENVNDGEEEKLAAWTYTHNGFYWAGAYVADDFVLVTTDDGAPGYLTGHGSVLSLNPNSGVLLDSLTATGVGDLRSTVCYDSETDAYYFTSKGGDFYRVKMNGNGTFQPNSLKALHLNNGSANAKTPPMSTSTPVVYKGRAYIGVSGVSQFGAYSGHNMTVIDLDRWAIAYTVPTQGYPQTSGLLTTCYEGDTEYVYVYFFDNYTPGKLRVIRDRAGQKELDHAYSTVETYVESGVTKTMETGYVLFTPDGAQAQYAICSPIVDTDGSIYFKNDSAYLMCLSSTITALEVTRQPDKTTYRPGETFDPTGMEVTAVYANGVRKDVTKYISYSKDPLTLEDTELTLTYSIGRYEQMYQDRDGVPGTKYLVPTGTVDLKIREEQEPTEPGKCDGGENCPSHGFKDVPGPNYWGHAAIDYGLRTGLFKGMSATTFCPNLAMDRAMVVTLLWRYEGEPEGSGTFTDVKESSYYAKAVAWASEAGVVNGYPEGTFRPKNKITRSEMVTMLYRYAEYKKKDVSARAELGDFADEGRIPKFARESMEWAVAEGLIKGSAGGGKQFLDPRGTATRVQMAQVLMRFIEEYMKK